MRPRNLSLAIFVLAMLALPVCAQPSAVDKQGHFKPESVRAPELRVIVDSLPPRLELQAARNAAGEIVARWLAVDPLLKADTLKNRSGLNSRDWIKYSTSTCAWAWIHCRPAFAFPTPRVNHVR